MITVKERTYNEQQQKQFVKKVHKYDWHSVSSYSRFHNAFQEIIDDTFPEILTAEDSQDVQIANRFNDYYVTIGKTKQQDIKKEVGGNKLLSDPLRFVDDSNLVKPFLAFKPVEEETVKQIITSLRNNPELSPDAYGLSVQLLQSINAKISSTITKLINKSFQEGAFPDELKLAAVQPYEKLRQVDYDRNDPSNFRPVSITSVLSKVFEDAVVLQLREHFESNNLFFEQQHGHREGRGVVSTIVTLLTVAASKIKEGQSVKLTMYNLGEAYDCVDHEILLSKLKRYGLGEKPIKYLESFIKGRSQFVRRCGCRSDTKDVHVGLPQGLKLAPFLFGVYINDLPNNLLDSLCTTLYVEVVFFITPYFESDVSIEQKVNAEVNMWLRGNLIHVEENNIQHLLIPYVKPVNIETVNFLGIILNNDLSWSEHIKHLIENKLINAKESIQEISAMGSPYKLVREAYFDFHARIARDILLWGHAEEANEIFDLQKEVISILEHRGSSFQSKFVYSRVLTLPSLYIRFCLCHAHNSSKLNTKMDLEIYRTEPKYTLTELYNALPENVRKLDQREFKTRITRILSESGICSIDEFLQKCSELS